MGTSTAQRHLVLTRCDAEAGLGEDDVSATVGLPVALQIPNDTAVTGSVNEGHPLTERDGTGPTAEAMTRLVDLVSPPVPVGSSGWIRRLLAMGRPEGPTSV